MSIKGFPSSQKLPLGTGITNEFVTVQPVDQYRNALDIPRYAFRVNALVKTAAVGTGTDISGLTWIYDTSTPAKKGDFIRFESGANQYLEVAIVAVETNRFLLGAAVSGAAPGDTFYIMRYATQRVDSSGSQLVTVSASNVTVKNTVYSNYGTAPVSNAGWTELIASTSADIYGYFYQESGGFPVELGIGGAGAETRIDVIFPGGFNGKKEIIIPAGSRISVRGLTANTMNDANTFIIASFLG